MRAIVAKLVAQPPFVLLDNCVLNKFQKFLIFYFIFLRYVLPAVLSKFDIIIQFLTATPDWSTIGKL